MRRIVAGAVALGVLLVTSGAVARGVGYVRKQEVEFTRGDDVSGSVVQPDGTWVRGVENMKPPTLIEYRYDFLSEMVRSLQDF